MAHYDDVPIVVYQGYSSGVADYAVKHGQLGGPHFSFVRMSWIKPNFLWMMYCCGWATKENQERVPGLRIGLRFFDRILEAAAPSVFDAARYGDHEYWKASSCARRWNGPFGPGASPPARPSLSMPSAY